MGEKTDNRDEIIALFQEVAIGHTTLETLESQSLIATYRDGDYLGICATDRLREIFGKDAAYVNAKDYNLLRARKDGCKNFLKQIERTERQNTQTASSPPKTMAVA